MRMNDLPRPTSRADSARQEPALLPPVDVIEDATGITLVADLPGVPRDRLNLRVEGDQLAIEAEVVLPAPEGVEPGTVIQAWTPAWTLHGRLLKPAMVVVAGKA